ncbi:hypothetical protein [Peribacillus muralis]|uniref:hypothetical protein n=1 Tax=Peribacillus muralis TaxID=264697 RepID=UPI00070936AF|nr:hypothetical protein [Peribacillus muralis]
MDGHSLNNIFEETGYLFLYDKFSYQFYVSGLFDLVDQERIISDFLSAYGFDEKNSLFFDDFSFHFNCFHYSHQKQKMLNFLRTDYDEHIC